MANVALQNFIYELVKNYEDRHALKLAADADFVDAFGFEIGQAIRGFLDGRTGSKSEKLLSVVESLEGDSEDAHAVLALAAADEAPEHRAQEESIILNDRLITRMQNLERFIRRIGKLDEFHDWVKREGS